MYEIRDWVIGEIDKEIIAVESPEETEANVLRTQAQALEERVSQ